MDDPALNFVKRVTGLPAEIAAHLAASGGILRCVVCGREEPAGSIGGHSQEGWPQCHDLTMSWVTLRELSAETRTVPPGYELVAVPDPWWRLEAGSLCARRAKNATCRELSVAALNRPRTVRGKPGRVDAWYPYCLSHLYGRWIEGGKVMHWILREEKDVDHG